MHGVVLADEIGPRGTGTGRATARAPSRRAACLVFRTNTLLSANWDSFSGGPARARSASRARLYLSATPMETEPQSDFVAVVVKDALR
jgi:hypothetical protein